MMQSIQIAFGLHQTDLTDFILIIGRFLVDRHPTSFRWSSLIHTLPALTKNCMIKYFKEQTQFKESQAFTRIYRA